MLHGTSAPRRDWSGDSYHKTEKTSKKLLQNRKWVPAAAIEAVHSGATEPNSSRMQESSAMTVSEMTCASSVGTETAGDDNECSRAGAAPRVGLLIVVSTVAVFYGGIAAYIWHLL